MGLVVSEMDMFSLDSDKDSNDPDFFTCRLIYVLFKITIHI
jgi:hypothetical protein